MGKKYQENSKKAAGQARKKEVDERRRLENEARVIAEEEAKWNDGAQKKLSKKQLDEQKRQEQLQKKAELEAELEAETANIKTAPKSKRNDRKNAAKGPGIDAALSAATAPSLSARNIDDAISALSLAAGKDPTKVERHPERRFKQALKAYEEARLPALKEEHPHLRLNQYKELMFKEFKKHPDNPFNQVSVDYNATQEDVQLHAEKERERLERKLAQ